MLFEIPLNLGLDISYKQGEFSITLPDKGLKFVPSKKNDTVVFNLDFMLIPAEIDFILEKRDYKGDTLKVNDTGAIKIIFALSIEIVTYYMGAIIV